MTKRSGYYRLGLTLSFLFALTAQTSQAASIFQIELIVAGGPDIVFDQSNPFNTSLDANTISIDKDALNNLLSSAFLITNLKFTNNLTATINSPGDPSGATLTQTDTAQVTSGTVSFSLIATGNDFIVPSGAAVLENSLGGTFTKTSTGNSSAMTSYFDQLNGANLPGSIVTPIQAYLAPNTNGPSAYGNPIPTSVTNFSASPFYALTSRIDVTLSGSTGPNGKVGVNQFVGSTTLSASAVPEPASVVMTLSALPIAFGLIRRYRRGVKTPG